MKIFKKLFLIIMLTITVSVLAFSSKVEAASFDPARIIDNTIFTNTSSMSAGDIQNFLNSKVPTCDTWHTAGPSAQGAVPPWTCLKNYYENISSGANNLNGQPIPAGSISAAQIIYNVAQTYNINPQVLIVTLQKENGLITDSWPYPWQYRTAMGFACPDNGSCDPAFYGFYKQVNQAARHFKNFYDLNPSWYIPFRPGINYVQYNPNAGCGGTSVNILNSATSALYSYTPYQPNAAALSNLYGTGDGCSAYGNRNFWRDFNNWFKTTLVDYKNVALNNKGAVLSAGQRLNAGDYLISENGSNILTLQEDGNLVLYRSGSPVWSSGTWLKQVGYLEMQPDGNLVIYSSPGNPIWASNTVGKNGSMLKMQSDSNLVMYTPSNSPVWHTGTWIDISQQNILYSTLRTGRLYQGQAIYSPNKKYRLTIQTDGNLVIYTATRPIWATNTWLKPVKFVAMQSDGNLVLYDETMKPYWDSGTWNRGLSRLVMQDDGNLVIYNSVGSPTWASNTVGR